MLKRIMAGCLAALIVGGAAFAVNGGGVPSFLRLQELSVGAGANLNNGAGTITVTKQVYSGGIVANSAITGALSPAVYGYFLGSGTGCPLQASSNDSAGSPSCSRTAAGNYVVSFTQVGSNTATCVASVSNSVTGNSWSIFVLASSNHVAVQTASAGTLTDAAFYLVCF